MGNPSVTRRRPAGERRAQILEAAARRFATHGYRGSSMQEIADDVGLLKGSLYYHFARKEDVLGALLVDVHHQALQMLDDVDAVSGGPLARVRAYVRAHLVWTLRHVDRVDIMLREYHHLPRERAREIARLRRRFADYLTERIAEAQRVGEVRADLQPRVAAHAILGMLNWAPTWYRPARGRHDAEFVDQVVSQAIAGIAAASGQPGRNVSG